MMVCIKCGREWPGQASRCPEDGTPLIAVRPRVGGTDDIEKTPLLVAPERGIAGLEAGDTVGDYEIVEVLGSGSVGVVYGAVHPVIGKRVAIKVLRPGLSHDELVVQRFVQEARVINQIGHPNIIGVFGFGALPDGRRYCVMDWLPGMTLAQRLREQELSIDQALDALVQIVDALQAAHAQGVVHRDLKPDNIYLAEQPGGRWVVRLLDFGVAKLVEPGLAGLADAPRTHTGVIIGSPGYIAPEQIRGEGVNGRCDVYALGAIAFRLLAGREPYAASSPVELMLRQMREAPPAPRRHNPELPRSLDRLVLAMLDRNPGNRPELSAVRAALVAGGQAGGVAVEARSRGRGTPSRWLPIGTLVAAAAGVAVAVLWLQRGSAGARAPETTVTPQAAEDAEPSLPPAMAAASAPADPTAPPEMRRATSLRIVTNVPRADFSVDGEVVARSQRSVEIPLARAGEHQLLITAKGYLPHRRAVQVAEGSLVELEVMLRPQRRTRRGGKGTEVDAGQEPSRDYILDPYRDSK